MATYWAILEKVPGSKLRLTKMDDDIFEHLKKDFPEFDPAEPINEDEMKSKTGKERWRNFMMAYEKKIDDYNFGTLLRSSHKTEYGEKETIFVPRMQFYAVEIARYVLPGCCVQGEGMLTDMTETAPASTTGSTRRRKRRGRRPRAAPRIPSIERIQNDFPVQSSSRDVTVMTLRVHVVVKVER